MHIVHIASELAPLAKVGGLADVVLGLSRELSWKGLDVDIIIPKYDCLDSSQIRDLTVDTQDLMSFYDGEWFHNTIWMGWVENLKVYFIEPHHPRYFFNRGCFYGCEDDIERYLYFSRLSLEFLYKRDISPDIIHLHDWQTAAIAPLYYTMYQKIGYNKPKIVFTIHNIEYQGKCAPHDLDKIGLDGKAFLTPKKLQDNVSPDLINLVKGAIVYADFVTTVSPNYAKEILTPEYGRGMESTLNFYRSKFTGILNGIDYSYWNPEIDRYLPIHYSSRETPLNKKDANTLDKKAFVKNVLRERLSLTEDYSPIVGCIARLVPQKGIELIKHAMEYTVSHKGQFILLGSSPIPSIQRDFMHLKKQFEDHSNIYLALHHQEELAHMIFAASDMFIVPSIFEPCGLTQMIALKYGAIPIVRKTGGLADTICDVDEEKEVEAQAFGYTFSDPTN
ncbi:MAG TPA: glycogen synthase GlgA, partial [Parachlamydiaceae bacterium]|nr:glycogen synthase GlgA [Parachlamydiaceae bacterium]